MVINRQKKYPGEILLINASKLFWKGRPKNYLAEEHLKQIADIYHHWTAVNGVSVVIKKEEAVKNDYNLSPSRYVSTGAGSEVLPLDEAVVLLRESEEERAEADRELSRILVQLGLTRPIE
jgi:type I restriction enzyme M protein